MQFLRGFAFFPLFPSWSCFQRLFNTFLFIVQFKVFSSQKMSKSPPSMLLVFFRVSGDWIKDSDVLHSNLFSHLSKVTWLHIQFTCHFTYSS